MDWDSARSLLVDKIRDELDKKHKEDSKGDRFKLREHLNAAVQFWCLPMLSLVLLACCALCCDPTSTLRYDALRGGIALMMYMVITQVLIIRVKHVELGEPSREVHPNLTLTLTRPRTLPLTPISLCVSAACGYDD